MVEGGTPDTLRRGITKDSLQDRHRDRGARLPVERRLCKPKCRANGRDAYVPGRPQAVHGLVGHRRRRRPDQTGSKLWLHVSAQEKIAVACPPRRARRCGLRGSCRSSASSPRSSRVPSAEPESGRRPPRTSLAVGCRSGRCFSLTPHSSECRSSGPTPATTNQIADRRQRNAASASTGLSCALLLAQQRRANTRTRCRCRA